ncbi:hypothetical protein OESDEN_02949 [Oesophagostomum dentatum]|uniref:Uncharacterized protein n=1 Tax=Oesophagostomum dentatum TaxID=61180 RepID=A0A0B1TLX9_OESDE|nr:hypothetical protein OESDEN_02949 [Oesophagostomum dentatum]
MRFAPECYMNGLYFQREWLAAQSTACAMQLIDKAVDLRDSQILNIESYQKMIWQRRFMALATAIAWIAVVVLIAALATPNWAVLDFMNTEYQQVHVQLGVWGEWRTVANSTHKTVEWIPHFPTPPENVARLADADLKHYYRAQAAIGVIALFLLLSTNVLALYTFYHHRFIYKRLTAGLYLLVGMAIVVTIEVLSNSVDEWNTAVAQASQVISNTTTGSILHTRDLTFGLQTLDGDWDYDAVKVTGYSTRLAQSVVAACLLAAAAFALGSHKQKGDNAATAEVEIEDRPIHIGR